MTNEEYIEMYPLQFKDELDKWLFKEFSIMAGCCSSIKSMEYSVAREVAEKAMSYARQQIMKEAKSGVGNYDNYIQFDDGTWIDLDPSANLKPAFNVEEGEKVTIAIIKED